VTLWAELDEDRWEVRKVDVFRNGTLRWADCDHEDEDTALGDCPTPTLEEIAAEPEFKPRTVTKDEFEAVWRAAIMGRARE